MSALSIVVPVDSEVRGFRSFLVRLLQAVAPLNGSEIIVVDGTVAADVSLTCRCNGVGVVRAVGGRVAQMARGAAQAQGDYLLFLDPNITLPANFADIWKGLRRAGPVWGFFPLRVSRGAWRLRWLARVISLRSRLSGIAVEDQPIFMQRNAWKLAGDVGDARADNFFGLCRRLRVITAPWVVQQSVDSQGVGWRSAGVRDVLFATLSSRLHIRGTEPRSVTASLAGGTTSAGRKRTAELP